MTCLRLLAAALLLALTSASFAHEGHKDDKSDAELIAETLADKHAMTADMASPAPSQAEFLQQQLEANRLASGDDLLGRLHPVAVHFPIALFVMALVAEIILMKRPTAGLETSVRLLAAGGGVGAAVSALLGWFAAGWRMTDRSDVLQLHRWNGTAIAMVGLVAWWQSTRAGSRLTLRLLLVALVLALAYQGYLGGEMVFGPNHLGLR